MLVPRNFLLTPPLCTEGLGGNNALSEVTRLYELQGVSGVGWKGLEGLMTLGAVDIGSVCVFTPPVNSLASQIFYNIPSKQR